MCFQTRGYSTHSQVEQYRSMLCEPHSATYLYRWNNLRRISRGIFDSTRYPTRQRLDNIRFALIGIHRNGSRSPLTQKRWFRSRKERTTSASRRITSFGHFERVVNRVSNGRQSLIVIESRRRTDDRAKRKAKVT